MGRALRIAIGMGWLLSAGVVGVALTPGKADACVYCQGFAPGVEGFCNCQVTDGATFCTDVNGHDTQVCNIPCIGHRQLCVG